MSRKRKGEMKKETQVGSMEGNFISEGLFMFTLVRCYREFYHGKGYLLTDIKKLVTFIFLGYGKEVSMNVIIWQSRKMSIHGGWLDALVKL